MQAAQLADERALTMLGRVQVRAAELPDPYVISRTLSRREAVDSSGIEERISTLTALLTIAEGEDGARDAARKVRGYARTLDRLLASASAEGCDIFAPQLIKERDREAMRHDAV
jgi:hypothetical protein